MRLFKSVVRNSAATAARDRLPMFDALKALASQLIVLHHLAFYGPLSEALHRALPHLQDWLVAYGRLAVQIFLVIGGFFAAKALAPHGEGAVASPLKLVWKRYCRLVVPFAAALLLAMLAAAVARHWLDDEMVPAAPAFRQVLTHLLLLHGVLGAESLSAGVWYVAIDFQLFLLTVALVWLAQRSGLRAYSPLPVGLLALASLFYFNRDAGWDNWAVYFFGSYALGAAAYWASARGRNLPWLLAIAVVGALALTLDFRIRIALALVTALSLCLFHQTGWMARWPDFRLTAFLGRISYSVFLVHFPVALVANAVCARFYAGRTGAALIVLLAAWAASLVVGALFYRYVESRPLPDGRRLAAALAAKLLALLSAVRLRSAPSSPERV